MVSKVFGCQCDEMIASGFLAIGVIPFCALVSSSFKGHLLLFLVLFLRYVCIYV